ncbi:hypothetical protein CEP53_004999 [Fusarium sp. AF-6]|nr:hypothetical protein CEP53_004999 [Fusarium sp. AF-6]
MKSISFVLTFLLSSVLAAPFESTYSSLSAREEAGLFDDLKGGSLGPRASNDALVARATDDLDELIASLGGQGKRDIEALSKREEALLGELLGSLLGGLTGGSGGVGDLTKGVTDAVGGVTGGLTGSAGGLTKELTEKLGGVTGSAGGLPKDLTEKLSGLAGGKSGEDGADKKNESDKQKREEALLGDLLGSLLGGLTGGSGGVGDLTKELTEKLGGVTGSAGGLPKDLTEKLGGLTGGVTGGKSGEDNADKKESDKQKREEAIAGLPLDSLLGKLPLKDLLSIIGGLSKGGLSKREEALAGPLENLLKGLPLKDLLSIFGGLSKRDLSKREEAIAGLPLDSLLGKLPLKDLLSIIGGLSKGGLSKREEAIAGLPFSLEDLLGLEKLLGGLGLGKRDGQELSEREVAGIGRILSLNLLPLLGKGSGKREEPKTEELIDPIFANTGVTAEGSPVERRDPFVLPPEVIKALIRQQIEEAKKGKTNSKDKSNDKDKRETASHDEVAGDVSTDDIKKILESLLGGDIKLPATDPIKKVAEDKVGDAKDAAQDASGKVKEAVAAVDPPSA